MPLCQARAIGRKRDGRTPHLQRSNRHTHRHRVDRRCGHERPGQVARVVPAAWQAIARDARPGDPWDADGALETVSPTGTRDRRRGASPRATESPSAAASLPPRERRHTAPRAQGDRGSDDPRGEGCARRKPDTALGGIPERGRRRRPPEQGSRPRSNWALFPHACGRLNRHDGALPPGATTETVEGMALEKSDARMDALHHERSRWTPVRRPSIPQTAGKLRPRGLPTCSDQRRQAGGRRLREAYDAPPLSPHSHGCRPGCGGHPARGEITKSWRGVTGFIEGDLAHGFDCLDPEVLRSIRRQSLQDDRGLRLLSHRLTAGDLAAWRVHATRRGAPHGGVVHPSLRPIARDQLDQGVETILHPSPTAQPEGHRLRRTGRACRPRGTSASRESAKRPRPCEGRRSSGRRELPTSQRSAGSGQISCWRVVTKRLNAAGPASVATRTTRPSTSAASAREHGSGRH